MSDVFNVTAAFDKTAYNGGEIAKVTISGDDVETITTVTNGKVGPLQLKITAENGAETMISVPEVDAAFSSTTTTHRSVRITEVIDNGATPRFWTIDASGLFATATV